MHVRVVGRQITGLALLLAGAASACSTPVYRYALERWEPDTYILETRLPEPVPPDLETALAELQAREDVNVAVRELKAGDGEPALTLRFPRVPPTHPPVISLPPTAANLALLLDSPARAETAKRLMAGETAVFLFLESDDAKKNKTVLERLNRIIGDLEKNLELPAQEPEDTLAEDEDPAGDLKIDFSIVRVRRDDPKEKVLVETLLATEPDLRELRGPMAFPVFGRGRSLYAIVDKGINAEVLYEAGAFMTGACSCQVKAQNPGVDLLMTAAWNSIFEDLVYEEVELPPLTAISIGGKDNDGAASKEDAPEIPAGEQAMQGQQSVDESGGNSGDDRREPLSALVFALPLLVLAGTLVLLLRSRKS